LSEDPTVQLYKIKSALENIEQRIELFADCLFKEIDRLDERIDKIEGKPTRRELRAQGIKHRIRTLRPTRSRL